MNRAKLITAALAAISSVCLMAQQAPTTSPSTNPQPGSQTTDVQQTPAAAQPVASTANSPQASNPVLRPVQGELESKLDTKNAKAGDSVVVKTTEKATTADGIEIPKGSKILGHVTDVEAKGKSSENSRVTIQFDQAELKGGQNLSIKSVLQSVAPASGHDPDIASSGLAGSAAGGPAATGSMNAGGPAAGASGSQSTGSSTGERTAQAPTSGGPASDSAQTSQSGAAPAAGTVVARNGNVAIRTTAIPGVLLANNADGQPFSNASGALLGAKCDVHLDSGTHVVVALADTGAKSTR